MKGLYFLLGVAVGAAGTYFVVKGKFERQAQEEIDSVKETYKAKEREAKKEEKEEPLVEIKHVKPDLNEYVRKADEYRRYSTTVEKPEDPVHKPFKEEPVLIEESEFGEIENYDAVTLVYYSDGVLADDMSDEIVENADELVGTDYIQALEKSDAVYVRNDIEKKDYEIVKNLQTYKEFTGNDPSPAETEE